MLTIIPALPACRGKNGGIILTKKFLEGMEIYQKLWNGPVKAVLDLNEEETNNLDNVEVMPGDTSFQIETTKFDDPTLCDLSKKISGSKIVLGGPHYKLHGLGLRLKQMGIVTVPCVEYTLRTRVDMARHAEKSITRVFKRSAWETREELWTLLEIKSAAGVQCNGTPTYDAYSKLNRNCHLYFDTRTPTSDFATHEHMLMRAQRLMNKQPIRIAFSGRLLEIKGAHHLIPYAKHLKEMNVNFELSICGGGKLAENIAQSISTQGLSNCVKYHGVLDFKAKLLPKMREKIDLFVAPHVQGDPSCTYLETLACGVPIVGYANEAWSGILERASVGWKTPIADVKKLAAATSKIVQNPAELLNRARAGLAFAQEHSFEKTFTRRIDHLASLLK